jgi:hypothetical protein
MIYKSPISIQNIQNRIHHLKKTSSLSPNIIGMFLLTMIILTLYYRYKAPYKIPKEYDPMNFKNEMYLKE